MDKFLEKYEHENISISYNNYKNKFNTEKITKSLKKLRNKFININEFKEEYNKFIDNIKNFRDLDQDKDKGKNKVSISKNQKNWKDMQEI